MESWRCVADRDNSDICQRRSRSTSLWSWSCFYCEREKGQIPTCLQRDPDEKNTSISMCDVDERHGYKGGIREICISMFMCTPRNQENARQHGFDDAMSYHLLGYGHSKLIGNNTESTTPQSLRYRHIVCTLSGQY